jgi:hypothetical protein
LPNVRIVAAYPWEASADAHVVTVTLENLGNAGAEVPVTLNMEQGEMTKRLQVLGKAKVTVRIEALSAPLEVVANDGSVPESDLSNNVYKIEAPKKKN